MFLCPLSGTSETVSLCLLSRASRAVLKLCFCVRCQGHQNHVFVSAVMDINIKFLCPLSGTSETVSLCLLSRASKDFINICCEILDIAFSAYTDKQNRKKREQRNCFSIFIHRL